MNSLVLLEETLRIRHVASITIPRRGHEGCPLVITPQSELSSHLSGVSMSCSYVSSDDAGASSLATKYSRTWKNSNLSEAK